MAKGQIHLSPSGPAPCSANAGTCPYEADGHYSSLEEAEVAFADQMGGELPGPVSKPTDRVKLKLDFDSVEVANGDLGDPKVRGYFANGLCGDLANAIHSIDPSRRLYFSLDTDADGRPTAEELSAMDSIDQLSPFVFHAVVESRSQPGKFLDSYGVKSREEIEGFFGGPLVEAPSSVFRGFHSGEDHDLSGFAEAALELDRTGRSYSYEDYGD